VLREVVLKYGWRLAGGGYDLIAPCVIESPHFFLKSLLQGVEEGPDAAIEAEARVRKLADEWKSKLPQEKHEEFEEILEVGRRFFRLRDERGLCTDLTGVGLCRRGILEGGRRLAEQGIIYEPDHLCVATKNEAIALLRGDLNLLSSHGGGKKTSTLEIPTPRELERRYRYIKTADPSLIPRALGTPPPPPDFSTLSPGISRSMAGFATAGLRGVWDEPTDEEDEDDIRNSEDVVKGVPASMGICEGPVRLSSSGRRSPAGQEGRHCCHLLLFGIVQHCSCPLRGNLYRLWRNVVTRRNCRTRVRYPSCGWISTRNSQVQEWRYRPHRQQCTAEPKNHKNP
jgi:hypothetical protein